MDETVTHRRATAEGTLAIFELGQLLNALHNAACPEIYAPATAEFFS
ncbi:hypothetical protein [Pseudomonas sp. HLT2-19-2]